MTLVMVVVASAAAVPAYAQYRMCTEERGAAQIGVTAIDCRECDVFTSWVMFRAEPSIAGIAPGSPAEGRLQHGDVITRINGRAITTREATMAWAHPRAGEPLRVDVRRGVSAATTSIVPLPVCGAIEPQQPQRVDVPIAGLGMGLQCGRSCSSSYTNGALLRWRFAEPPLVVNIHSDGRAARAGIVRGDRIIAIDGRLMVTDEGGAAFADLARGAPAELLIERYGNRVRVHVQ